MKENDLKKLEFLVTLNDNIVVQRYFNVREYNENAGKSIELYSAIKTAVENIQDIMKMKTLNYMSDNYFQIATDENIIETSNTDGPEIFNVYVKDGDKTICHRIFDGKLYPPKIRYTLDIRPILKPLLRNLTDIFSDEELEYNFMNYELV